MDIMTVIDTAKNKLLDCYRKNDSDGVKYYEAYIDGAKAQLEADIIRCSDNMKKMIGSTEYEYKKNNEKRSFWNF